MHMKKKLFKALLGLFVVTLLTQCKKSVVSDVQAEPATPKTELNVLRQEALVQILEMGKNREFRTYVLNECLKQKHGDYNVYLSDIVAAYSGKQELKKNVEKLEALSTKIKAAANGREPLLFYPRTETIEESRKKNANARTASENLQEPIGVFEEVYNPDYSSPGYIVDYNGSFNFYQNITEEYAWENDVWVIGEEENVSSDNMLPAVEDFNLNPARVNGEAEYGAIIQLTDMNALEHWTAGKFEFKYVVNSASGALIKERAFGKTKRKYFRDNKWYDYNDFIANWNISNIGNWMIEGWIEEDGGNSTTNISQTFPAPCTGCPSTTVSYSRQNKDQDMGRTMVQFSDNKGQVYNITYANLKRK
jgi:hypothetical protein